MDREWKKTDQYKAIQKAARAQAQQQKIREAMERAEREIRKQELEAEREKALAIRERDRAAVAKLAAERKAIEHRTRRSRIDWSELLDNPVTVERQVQWERQTTALAMRQAGLTFRAIGARMGLSGSGAQQLVWRAECRKPGAVSPAEAYMNAELHKEVQDMIPCKVATKSRPVSIITWTGPFIEFDPLAMFGG